MDARVREQESRRTSIKRPWEDTTIPGEIDGRQTISLPPIDIVPFRRPSIPRGVESGIFSDIPYGQDSRERAAKKSKFDVYDYNTIPGHIPKIEPPNQFRLSNVEYTHHGGSIGSPTLLSQQGRAIGEPADPQEGTVLCTRCRRLATQVEELDLYGVPSTCGSCRRNPELALVTEAAASALTRLMGTLRSGKSFEQRIIIRVS